MFLENKSVITFFCVLLSIASILIPGPAVPIISFILTAVILIYRINTDLKNPEKHRTVIIEIVIIAVLIVVDIGSCTVKLIKEIQYNNYENTLESGIQEAIESTILLYKYQNFNLFSGKQNNTAKILSGFTQFLKKEMEFKKTTIQGNKIICQLGSATITFTVTQNNISYAIQY